MPARKYLPRSQGYLCYKATRKPHRALGLPGTPTKGVGRAAGCCCSVFSKNLTPESHGSHWPVLENPLTELPLQFKALTPNIKQQCLLPSFKLYPRYR